MGRSKPWIGFRHAARRRKNKPARSDGDSYTKRTENLLKMGFNNYDDYLSSGLWAAVKIAAFEKRGKNCLICTKPAKVIHHLDYAMETLQGTRMGSLVPICDPCHKRVEFDGEKKRTLRDVKQLTLSLIANSKNVKKKEKNRRKCVRCGWNISRHRVYCRRCEHQLSQPYA